MTENNTPFHSSICDLLGIKYPILQGAMQGGGGADLVAAVSEAGGLGVLPTFGGTEAALIKDITRVRKMTDKPIAVNITAMGKAFTDSRIGICIDQGIDIITTGRADPGEAAVRRMKDEGMTIVSVIPSVAHAKLMVDEGVDALVASGSEAGGHVGTVATFPLVPAVVDAVDVPVLAAGGIGDARGFLASLALGAVGVQIGTLFMATPESNLGQWGKDRLLEMAETDTLVTTALTGATVRCFATADLRAFEEARMSGATKKELSALVKAARGVGSTERNGPKQGAAGQVAGLIHKIRPVGELIEQMISEAETLLQQLYKQAHGS